jgi:hypothetical protein
MYFSRRRHRIEPSDRPINQHIGEQPQTFPRRRGETPYRSSDNDDDFDTVFWTQPAAQPL